MRVCLQACITSIWAPVIGTHTYQLSVSLKLQNRDRIRKFPRSAFSAQSCFSLFPPLCLSLCGLFAQSSAGLINHTSGGTGESRVDLSSQHWDGKGNLVVVVGEAWSFPKDRRAQRFRNGDMDSFVDAWRNKSKI